MKTIKYGIIGCGMMGQEHLRNIALLSDVEASVIYEPDAGMRAAAADLAPMATFADSELDVLNAPDIDCLLVVSPNHGAQPPNCHLPLPGSLGLAPFGGSGPRQVGQTIPTGPWARQPAQRR